MMRTHAEKGELWPTPTLTMVLEEANEFNRSLAKIILSEEEKIVGNSRPTEVAGIKDGLTAYWLNFNVLNWKYPEIEEFRSIVLSGLHQWLKMLGNADAPDMEVSGISCWANVLRHGESLHVHHHDPAFVSAHYTVQVGHNGGVSNRSRDSGHTIYFRPGFLDRSHGGDPFMAPSPWDHDWRLDRPAIEGHLFFFPSFVRHEVRPYSGETQRISIAMDVFLKCQRLPIYFGGPRWFVPK
jgi:hypothetical protein